MAERVIVPVTDTIMSKPPDLMQGTLDALILSIIAVEPLHGLAISHRLRAKSADVLQASKGSLYPALHKLEHLGLLRSEWRLAETGKRAKYYSLTKAGARRLGKELKEWKRLSTAITLVLKPT
jgi:PadR family transcriptional regulator, regulatory protein PadR